ncbi:murein biosynthesis integral membrane protein MurJ [Psychrobacillus sp. FSL H8-0487]|uniref:murein biosynthesis integral membrane protein MurJ n=1 Tax=Psychrobacillus sp. FSL H8-0487 TaxID=2921391 RepID=UPI0030F7680A
MNTFLKIVGAVAVINIVARLFGFLREMIIGYQYGTSYIADSIFTAYTIPNFLYLVIGGAFTTAFISIYNQKKTDQGLFVKQAFTTVITTIIIITILMLLATNPILNLFFGEMSDEESRLARNLFYWMMPSTIFLVLSTWLSGMLNVNGKFHLSSISILLYNAVFLIISVVSSYWIGPIAYGIGALISALIMVGFLIKGYRKLEKFPIGVSFQQTWTTKQLWRLALPIMLGGATIQFYALIQRIFSATLSDGFVSAVNYATKLTQFPQAILMTAVTTVIYPMLSKKVAEKDHNAVKKIYTSGLRYLVILLVPVTIFSFFYAENLIQIIFEYGNFDEVSTAITAPILEIFLLTMFFLAANTYVTRFYYAKGNSITPVIFSIINVFVINIIIIYFLIDSIGAMAIAWGTLISSVINFIMLFVYANKKYELTFFNSWNKGIGKIFVAILLMGFVTYFSNEFIQLSSKWLTFLVGLSIFGFSYVCFFLLLKVAEANIILMKLKSSIKRLINIKNK